MWRKYGGGISFLWKRRVIIIIIIIINNVCAFESKNRVNHNPLYLYIYYTRRNPVGNIKIISNNSLYDTYRYSTPMQSNVLDVVQISIHSSILPVKQLVRENRRRFGVAYSLHSERISPSKGCAAYNVQMTEHAVSVIRYISNTWYILFTYIHIYLFIYTFTHNIYNIITIHIRCGFTAV